MLFSDYFHVDKNVIAQYGAVDISLFADTPLFIDPLLIYGSEDETIRRLYSKISSYLMFLDKVVSSGLTKDSIKYYFRFKEIKQNWLGVSTHGNNGNALGDKFAKELSESIKTICDNDNISNEVHIEKMFLVKRGVGKDRISDWVTNVLLGFFVDFTEKFAAEYIDPKYCKEFEIQKYSFNYDTGLFDSKIVCLPFITKDGCDEYVLLTPKSILRRDEQAISFDNFAKDFGVLRTTLPNETLRFQINQLFAIEKKKLYDERCEKEEPVTSSDLQRLENTFFELAIEQFPQLFDYYIKNKEIDVKSIRRIAADEVDAVLKTINENQIIFSDPFDFQGITEFKTAFDEALYRVKYLKNQIENNGLWRSLYYGDEPIKQEDYLQRLFALCWCRSRFRFSPESNSGVGPVDFLISYGFKNATLVEFKLASNSKISNVFEQVDAYQESQRTQGKSVIVVFYFSQAEKEKAQRLLEGANTQKYELVYIDCNKDTKASASLR